MKFITLLICFLLCASAMASAQSSGSRSPLLTPVPPPAVSVAEQAGAPLVVSLPATRWATPDREMLDLYAVVKNVGTRAVRAYATRADLQVGDDDRGCFAYNILAPGKVLQPGQTDGKSNFVGFARDATPAQINVSLDFVEFTDNTTWGDDTCGTAKRLDGERAGGRATLELLRSVMREGGTQAVLDRLKAGKAEVSMPEDRPRRWRMAFASAWREVVERIMRAYRDKGLEGIEEALLKPYDASEAEISVRVIAPPQH